MTRLLYWNIENFAYNKIANPDTKRRKTGSSLKESQAAQDRRDLIDKVITAAAPDIIVVVEVETAYDGREVLCRGTGLDGCLEFGNMLRSGSPDWMLVPPLQTGPNEGVGVFYNKTQRFFTGPKVWPGGNGPSAAPGTATARYPLDNVLPSTVVPAGALQNVGVRQDRCAASTSFTVRAGEPNAGAPMVWGPKLRAPYTVSFAETDNAGTVQRNLTLFAIHSPAKTFSAEPFLKDSLPVLAEVVDNLGANEVRVVLGDFNVNLMHADLTPSTAYTTLLQAPCNYTLALPPVAPPAPNPDGYKWYYGTHLLRQFSARCWELGGVTAYYPGYGYMGSERVGNTYAIDNIYTRYGANLAPPGNTNVTILNPVVGSPYLAVAPPSGGAPPGSVPFTRLLDDPPPAPPNPPPAQAPVYNGTLLRFQGWDNFGVIRSTSDHLPLVIDI